MELGGFWNSKETQQQRLVPKIMTCCFEIINLFMHSFLSELLGTIFSLCHCTVENVCHVMANVSARLGSVLLLFTSCPVMVVRSMYLGI